MKQFIVGKDEIKEMAANIQRTSELFFPHIIKSAREKNSWIAQTLTMAIAILGGGFLLFQREENWVISVGLVLLFVMVFIGLILIYRGDKDFEDRLMGVYGKVTDYNLRALEYYTLLTKQDLTDVDKLRKRELEDYFLKFFKEFGIMAENGTAGGVEKKILESIEKKKGDAGVYFLMIGFLAGGLLLIFGTVL